MHGTVIHRSVNNVGYDIKVNLTDFHRINLSVSKHQSTDASSAPRITETRNVLRKSLSHLTPFSCQQQDIATQLQTINIWRGCKVKLPPSRLTWSDMDYGQCGICRGKGETAYGIVHSLNSNGELGKLKSSPPLLLLVWLFVGTRISLSMEYLISSTVKRSCIRLTSGCIIYITSSQMPESGFSKVLTSCRVTV